MADKIRIGVVGCGAIAQQGHLPFYQKSNMVGEIVVADPSAERLDEVRKAFKSVKGVYTDYREMLKKEKPDAVSVCTPNKLHAPVTIAAAAHGAHVLCEKPMAPTVKEAEAMIAACERAGTMLMINFTQRFFKGTQKVKQLLDAGKIGNPHTIRIRYVHGGPYANWAKSDWFYNPSLAGGGALMDMGVHAIDTTHYLLGPITTVCASLKNLTKDIPVEDSAMIMAELNDGRRAFIEAGWTGGGGFSGIEICGSEGSIVMDFRKGLFLSAGKSLPDGSILFKEKGIPCDLTAGGWGAGIKCFLAHIQDGTAPECNGAAGVAAIKVLQAAYLSNKTGRRIAID